MLFAVYKSNKKIDTYLYVGKKDDFSAVPEQLLSAFGEPEFVLVADSQKRSTLAGLSIDNFVQKFTEKNFYLQLPKTAQDLLKIHKQSKLD